jgi:hypothetical protein
VQTEGTVFAFVAPHEAGTELLRAADMVRKAAYDHVKSTADNGAPVFLSNCSARAPEEGVNFWTTAT